MNSAHSATGPRRRGAPPADRRLTRDAVIAAAEQLIERAGDQAFSLRALARALDVRPAALYNHVASRDDLLDAITASLLADLRPPPIGDRQWPHWIRDFADSLYRRMRERPAAGRLLLSRARGVPAGPILLRQFLEALGAAGVDRATAHLAWHAILSTVVGVLQQEGNRGTDPAATFHAVLDVVIDGLTESAQHAPSERSATLLRAHASAHDVT